MSYARNKQKQSEYNKQYYTKNKDELLPKIRERVGKWQKENGEHLSVKNKERRSDQRAKIGTTYNAIASKKYRTKLKREVVDRMGGKCTCCGETEIEFLTVDHVNNDGNTERKAGKFKPGGSYSFLIVKQQGYPNKYQLLCFNCNYSKHLGNGVCIHQRPKT